MNLKRIDAIDINFVDSAATKNLKILNSKGMGESRLYVGHDEELLDGFFELNNIEYFFFLKNDLVNYMLDSKNEYFNPSRDYKEKISEYYNDNLDSVQGLTQDKIKVYFRKTYDNQSRYYLVLDSIKDNRKNYAYLRNICLPRMTVITFVKFEDTDTNKKFIYMKPIFFIDAHEQEIRNMEKVVSQTAGSGNDVEKVKERYRKRQTQYRLELLDKMPACLITKVSDDRLLMACHVKPYAICETDDEKYDVKNGIVLTPTYHTLFDLGFISFSKEGKLLISPFLSNLNKHRLGLQENTVYRLQNGTEKYMKYHREHIFNTIKFDEFDLID